MPETLPHPSEQTLSSAIASRGLSELLEMRPYLFPCNYKPQNERRELVSSFFKKKAITSSPTGRWRGWTRSLQPGSLTQSASLVGQGPLACGPRRSCLGTASKLDVVSEGADTSFPGSRGENRRVLPGRLTPQLHRARAVWEAPAGGLLSLGGVRRPQGVTSNLTHEIYERFRDPVGANFTLTLEAWALQSGQSGENEGVQGSTEKLSDRPRPPQASPRDAPRATSWRLSCTLLRACASRWLARVSPWLRSFPQLSPSLHMEVHVHTRSCFHACVCPSLLPFCSHWVPNPFSFYLPALFSPGSKASP